MGYSKDGNIGIYKITNPLGMVYIGQSWNIENRWSAHKRGSKNCLKLISSLNDFGYDNHTFHICQSLPNDIEQSVLNDYEQLYMDVYKSAGIALLNLREGGGRGKHSEQSKLKMSLASKGKIISEDAKKKMSIAKLGHKRSAESIAKTRAAVIGRKMPIESVIKSANAKMGVKRSDETKRKISLAFKGKPWSEARRAAHNIKS